MKIAALILAAGRASRMGGDNKLLADLDGAPLIARTVAHVVASQAQPVILVAGHRAADIRAAIAGLSAEVVDNPDYASGMASSLRVGLSRVPLDSDGAIAMLGDMPLIQPATIDRLIAESVVFPDAAAIVPTVSGEWAHPVLLRRRLFHAAMALGGDMGARRILQARSDVHMLAFDDPRLLLDADDPEALRRVREEWARRS